MRSLMGWVGLSVIVCAFTAQAENWKGDYNKIEGSGWTKLDSDWCGGHARVSCDGKNCELQIVNSKCENIEVYLEQSGDYFRPVSSSYATKLVRATNGFYAGNIYIDLRRAKTNDPGDFWGWRNYWVNAVLHDGGTYEKICPNFKGKNIR